MTAPVISVLMTVFNTEAYLGEAVGSVLCQTVSDLELIVIDDCSSDRSWSIMTEVASRDARILPLRRERRGGASAGLNTGLAFAKGEYITRQDSDDVSLPNRLSEQIAFLESHPRVGAIGTAVTVIDPEGNRLGTWRFPAMDADIQSTLLDHMCFCGPTVMVRRAAFETAGFLFDEALSGSEDYDLCLRLAEVTSLANLPQPLYLYRQHPGSVSRSDQHHQLVRKAAALENAVHRRFGPVPPSRALASAARDYLRAAVIGCAVDGSAEARDWVERAVALDPEILRDTAAIEDLVRTWTPVLPTSLAVRSTQALFNDVFPRTRRLAWVTRKLVAELHMKQVFANAGQCDTRQHLWSAIRCNPTWLTNRGVVSLLVKDLFARRGLSAASQDAGWARRLARRTPPPPAEDV